MKKIFTFLIVAVLSVITAAARGVDELPLVEHNGVLCHYYVVQPKETVYSLTGKLGITADELIAANPAVADGLKAHSILYFPVKDSEKEATTITHQVKKGETVYGLSKELGVSIDELIAQNPFLRDGGLKAGQTITVTVGAAVTPEAIAEVQHQPTPQTKQPAVEKIHTPEPAAVKVTPVTPETHIVTTDPDNSVKTVSEKPIEKPLGIAIMLPFILGQEKPEKAALRNTEFLKGFLLAADTLRNAGKPVSIYAFDTANNSDTVAAILRRPEMKRVSLIVAPDNDDQLAMIARWGMENNVAVLNSFAVRDKLHMSNPAVIQANIPHDLMYDMAIDGLTERYPGHTIVILSREGGPTDHSEFIDELRLRLGEKGMSPINLTYTDKLTAGALASLPAGKPLVFIPVSGKQAELNRIMPALIELKEAAVMSDDVLLFGYPEWITYRGETLAGMQKLDTTVYSRFYNDPESTDTKNVEQNFNRWFGTPMEAAVPRQGLLGFDTGMMAIRTLRNNNGDFNTQSLHFTGVQNGFDFKPANSSDPGAAGKVNSVLFLVNFRPSGFTSRTML